MSHLVIKQLRKSFGTQRVLTDIDLTVGRGQFVALLGPSGCGKSTLLRIIAGLEVVSAGSVTINGRDITFLPPEKRNVALMFQSYALLPHMTVFENVRFPLRMRKRHPVAEQRIRVDKALNLVHLEDLGARYPRQLSGGQQQRVALARSIVAEPDVLLLDEPLSNLDARLREEMQIELKRLHEQLGLTTVFVTHDQTEALALADTVVLMNNGKIEQQGSPEQIYQRPRTAFAADFLGGANIVEIDVRQTNDGPRGILPDGAEIQLNKADAPKPGKRRYMLRTEAIIFNSNDEALTSLPGKLETQNYLGSIKRSVIIVGGTRMIALTQAKATPDAGADIRIGWNISDLVLLND
jgi:putative spermidine/putrescine transport system ATP-binding protein